MGASEVCPPWQAAVPEQSVRALTVYLRKAVKKEGHPVDFRLQVSRFLVIVGGYKSTEQFLASWGVDQAGFHEGLELRVVVGCNFRLFNIDS